VKFTRQGSGWTGDKTYKEILAAYRAGAHVEAEVPSEALDGEVLVIPLVFVNTHPNFNALTFYWERTFAPPGGYGDVKIYIVEATIQPNNWWVEYREDSFPACKCGRDPVPV
jgi:hypothetical protein